jgi:hypothetical protein
MSMIDQKMKLGMLVILLLGLLTACGHSIPTASNDILSHKKSVLVLTSPALNTSQQTNLSESLHTWKQDELITSEWIKPINVVDELLINKINKTAYSYILVLGNQLTQTALAAAAQTPDRRWILLSDTMHPELNPPATPDNVALRQLNTADLAAQQEEWLNQQKILGTNGLNNSVGAVTYQTLNSSTVPATDIQLSLNVVWNWNAILAEQLKVIQTDNFEKGIHFYSSREIVINHQ